jgi:hypothetical protein
MAKGLSLIVMVHCNNPTDRRFIPELLARIARAVETADTALGVPPLRPHPGYRPPGGR